MGKSNTPQEQPRPSQEEANSILETAITHVKGVVEKGKDASVEQLRNLRAHMHTAREYVKHASEDARQAINAEIKLLHPALQELPDSLKTEAKSIEELAAKWGQNTVDAWKGYKNFAGEDAKAVKEAAKSGLDTFLTKVSDGFGKLGEWAQQAWDYMKPYVAKFVDNPAAKWILGEERLNRWKAYLGRSVEVEKLKEELTPLLPAQKNVALDIDAKGLTAFTQKYRKMLRLKNQTEANYTKADYFDELVGKNAINFDALEAGDDGKRALTMQDVVKAAETYNQKVEAERKQQPQPAQTPTATPTNTPLPPNVA